MWNVTKRRHFYLVLILGALTTLSPFSIDMYLPGFPAIARSLGTTTAEVTHSLSSFFIGLACGQLIYGPLMDRFGRRKPLFGGLALYVLASIGCACSHSMAWLIALRFVQALGSSAAAVAPMAMVRDLFPVEENAKVMTSLIIVVSASPMLAPTIGSYLTAAFGWQSVFVALLLLAILMGLAVAFALPESHRRHPDFHLEFRVITRSFLLVGRNAQFYTYAVGGCVAFSGLLAYVAGSPTVFMETFRVSGKVYGWIFAFLSFGFIGFSQCNFILLRRYRSEQIVNAALIGQTVIGLVLLMGALQGWLGLSSTIALLFAYLITLGLANPNASALAMAPFSQNAGTAAAFIGALQCSTGALASYGVGALPTSTLVAVATIMAAAAVLGLGMVWTGRRNIHGAVPASPASQPIG